MLFKISHIINSHIIKKEDTEDIYFAKCPQGWMRQLLSTSVS